MPPANTAVMPAEKIVRPIVEPLLPLPKQRVRSVAAGRLASIDILRGLVMVVMALDHVRAYLSASRFDPTDLTQTTLPLFLTRWVTHYCAPTFVLLAGMSAWIAGQRRTPREFSRVLVTRGLWLIVLEFTIVNFGWHFRVPFTPIIAQVIWAIGASMVILAGLVRLPRAVVAAIAVALIAGHNLLDGVQPASLGILGPLWTVLHVQATLPTLGLFVLYPLMPWIGVMALGWVLGPVVAGPKGPNRRALLLLGGGMILAWLVVRATNVYGDLVPWQAQSTGTLTFMSFLKAAKYPPSLVYLLMTLGPAVMALAVIDRLYQPVAGFLRVFGEVPLFYYVLHLYLVHLMALVIGAAQGFSLNTMSHVFISLPEQGYGLSLTLVYVCWAILLAVLYPPCKRFAEVKRLNRGAWWTSYV